jgi:CheY-like chemotaxis protein
MSQPSSLFLVDPDARSLETLTFGFEREGCKVTGTSDLQRAEQMVRTSGADLAVVTLRDPERPALEALAALRGAVKDLPIVALGPQGLKAEALRAGAADYLTLPTFLRDVIGVGKLSTLGTKTAVSNGAAQGKGDEGDELSTRLSEYYGLFYLLRAMASSERSGIVTLTRGNRRAELRVHEGTVVSASVGAMQGLPALHHMLLWEEAALSLTRRSIPKRSQMHLSAQEILDECERFLRDFAHAARDLGAPRTLYVQVGEPVAELRGLQQSQITPLLRLFDGRRVLADVIEASPFRIFDTVRMIRRLRDAGVLAIRPEQPGQDRNQGQSQGQGQGQAREPHAAGAAPSKNGAPKSMFEQWAMVPDQRGVVGDRRTTSRKLRPLDVPPSSPIPLTTKKGASAAGEIAAPKRKPTPAAVTNLAVAPTVQVQLDATGAPVGQPMVPADPATFPALQTPPPVRARGNTGPQVPLEDAPPPHSGAAPIPPRARGNTGPQVPLEDAPPPHSGATPIPPRARGNTGPQVPLEDAPPPRSSATPIPLRARGNTGPQTPLEDGPPPRSGATPIPIRARSGSGRQVTLDDALPAKAERTSERTPRPRKISGDAPTIAAEEFDAIEADFFAREADLYKREAIETFDDLDPDAGVPGHKPRKR